MSLENESTGFSEGLDKKFQRQRTTEGPYKNIFMADLV